MELNQDTIINIVIILGIGFLLFNLTKRIAQAALSIIATIFLVLVLFIWTPDSMATYLRLDTFLQPEHIEVIKTGYSKLVDFRQIVFEKVGIGKDKVTIAPTSTVGPKASHK